jgi:ribosomal protein S18 acetylase RimI-like enzyme
MMKKRMSVTIRPFDGSLEDAEGLLLVERATFDESPYPPAEVQAMLAEGQQHAWLARAGDEVVGFVVAFATQGLSGPCWEVDLLAVHPDWAGQGVATRLIRSASAYGAGVARRARAVVARENEGSAGAFMRAGFHPRPKAYELFIGRLEKLPLRPSVTAGVTVREATGPAEALPWRPDLETEYNLQPRPAPSTDSRLGTDWLWVAEVQGQPAGYLELIQVQTMLYRGIWIESLVARTTAARRALVNTAVNQAAGAGLDEIGAMVPNDQSALKDALRSAHLVSLGEFRWLVAELPLPGLATPTPPNGRPVGGGHPVGGGGEHA